MKSQKAETERLNKLVIKIREAWTPEKDNDMNTTRDLKIARGIGLIVEEHPNPDGICIMNDNGGFEGIWNPSEKPHQLQMIEDWVIEKGYGVIFWRNKTKTSYAIDGAAESFESMDLSKSEAFLQAVEQLIDNLKK